MDMVTVQECRLVSIMDELNTGVNIDPTAVAAPAVPEVSIAPIDPPPPVNPEVTAAKVVKAKIGLPTFDMPHDAMFQSIMDGQEENLRKHAAAMVDFQTSLRKQQVFNDLAQSQNRPFTPIEAETIKQFLNVKETDPQSVFEEFYAKNYVENLRKAAQDNPDSYLNEIMEQHPEAFEKGITTGVDLKAKKEFFKTLEAKVQEVTEGRSTVKALFDLLKGFAPVYNEYNLRAELSNQKNLLGALLDEEATKTYQLPFEQAKQRSVAIVNSLLSGKLGGNPDLAARYIQHLNDPSYTSTIIDNVFSAMDLIGLGAKPVGLLKRRQMNTALNKSLADLVKSEELPVGSQSAFNTDMLKLKQGFVPETVFEKTSEYTANEKTLADIKIKLTDRTLLETERTNLESHAKGLTEWLSDTNNKNQFKQGTISTSSYMADLGKRIEEASQRLDLKPAFTPEYAFNPKSASTVSHMQGMTKDIEARGADVAGNFKEAATASVTKEVNQALTVGPSPFDPMKGLTSSFNERLMAVKGDTRNFSQELVNRVVNDIQATGSKLADAIKNTIKIEQVPALLAERKNISALVEKARTEFPGLGNAVMDVKVRPDPITNLPMKDFYFGKDSITLFGTERTAKAFIIQNGFKDAARVEPKGSGYMVVVSKPQDVTDPLIRGLLHTTNGTRTPDSWLNAYGGYLGSFRTPEDTLAAENLMNRKAAAYGPSTLLKLAKEAGAEIQKLRGWSLPGSARRAKWNQWKLVMDEIRKVKDPVTGNYEGGFKTIGDLSHFYQNTIHRLPDDQEVAAAFHFQNQSAIVHELNNLRVRSEKLRVGAETHTVYTLQPKALDDPKKRSTPSVNVKVDGTIIKDHIPRDGEAILIVGKHLGQERVVSVDGFAKGIAEQRYLKAIQNGEKVLIRLTNPEEYPFKHWNTGEARPKYVLADTVDSKPLDWQQVVKRTLPDYDYDHYVAQPIIKYDPITKIHHYEGDRHIAAFNIRAMGGDVAEKLDKMREFFKADDLAGARAYHAATKLPQDFEEIHNWFKPDVTPEGLPVPARLSKDDKIRLIPYNKTVNDLDKDLQRQYEGSFRDQTKEGYRKDMPAGMDFFRDPKNPGQQMTLANQGSKANPLYSMTPVEYVTPITSMNRALNRAINDHFLNDYKMFSVEHWIQEAKEFLAVPDNSLAAAPTYFFHNPIWKTSAPVDKVNNLMTAQLQIRQFLGIQDKTATYLHAAAQTLADAMYDKGYKNALVPTWALPMLRDPTVYVRSMAFDMKLGLFALPQLWVQMQTFTNIFGIAGIRHAGSGTAATMLHQWSRFSHDPAILEHLDSIATRMGFRPGEFKEAHTLGTNTGFMNVANEHAIRDNPFGNALTGGDTGFLSFGRVAFTEGERSTRIGAWYTAYHEYRTANPTGAIGNAELRTILDRADLLTMNMSRASSSQLNQGLMSIPTQFLTYQLRTAELILGKRLTPIERARTFGFNALMYGVPVAFGLSGLPIGDAIRRDAIESGYTLGDGYINSMVTEGGLSTLIAALTGGGDLQKGNYYNVGERFGSKGFDQFDPLRSDEPWWKLIGGAASSTLVNTAISMDGFTRAMLSAFRDDNKAYQMTVDDLVAPFKEISSVLALSKFAMALNTGKWISKKEEPVSDVDKGNAIFMYLSGLQPQEQSDMYQKSLIRQHEKSLQETALQKFTQEHRRFIREQDTNPTQAAAHFKNAFAILRIAGYPEEKIPYAVAIANKSYESIINSTDWSLYTKDVPTERKQAAEQALDAVLKRNNSR